MWTSVYWRFSFTLHPSSKAVHLWPVVTFNWADSCQVSAQCKAFGVGGASTDAFLLSSSVRSGRGRLAGDVFSRAGVAWWRRWPRGRCGPSIWSGAYAFGNSEERTGKGHFRWKEEECFSNSERFVCPRKNRMLTPSKLKVSLAHVRIDSPFFGCHRAACLFLFSTCYRVLVFTFWLSLLNSLGLGMVSAVSICPQHWIPLTCLKVYQWTSV